MFSKSKYSHSHQRTRCLTLACLWLVSSDGHGHMWRNFVVDCNNVCHNNIWGSIIILPKSIITLILKKHKIYELATSPHVFIHFTDYISHYSLLQLTVHPIFHFRVRFITLEMCPFFEGSVSFVFLPRLLWWEGVSPMIMCPNYFSFCLRTSSINGVSPVISLSSLICYNWRTNYIVRSTKCLCLWGWLSAWWSDVGISNVTVCEPIWMAETV